MDLKEQIKDTYEKFSKEKQKEIKEVFELGKHYIESKFYLKWANTILIRYNNVKNEGQDVKYALAIMNTIQNKGFSAGLIKLEKLNNNDDINECLPVKEVLSIVQYFYINGTEFRELYDIKHPVKTTIIKETHIHNDEDEFWD